MPTTSGPTTNPAEDPMYVALAPIAVAKVRSEVGNHASLRTGPPKFSQVPATPFSAKLRTTAIRNAAPLSGRQRRAQESASVVDAQSVTALTPYLRDGTAHQPKDSHQVRKIVVR